MSSIKVAVLVGSLRKDSHNRTLAKAVERLAPKELSFEHLRIDNLALYNQDFDSDYPAEYRQFKEQVKAADALLFVTPEYNRSMPGVLKKRHRCGIAPVWHECLCRQAGGGYRYLDWRDRHGARTAAFAQCADLSGRRDAGAAGSFYQA